MSSFGINIQALNSRSQVPSSSVWRNRSSLPSTANAFSLNSLYGRRIRVSFSPVCLSWAYVCSFKWYFFLNSKDSVGSFLCKVVYISLEWPVKVNTDLKATAMMHFQAYFQPKSYWSVHHTESTVLGTLGGTGEPIMVLNCRAIPEFPQSGLTACSTTV